MVGAYLCIFIVFFTNSLWQKGWEGLKKTSIHPFVYALFALLDLEGNFLLVLAYQYTSITSVQLLDCWATVVVFILSWKYLAYQYSKSHLASAIVAFIGMCIIVLSDVEKASSKNAIFGDLLVILGSTLYGINNVLQEYLVKSFFEDNPLSKEFNPYFISEYLMFLGLFGSIFATIQMFITEYSQVAAIPWSGEVFLYYGGFWGVMIAFYYGVPTMLRKSSACAMNLNFLSADFWAVLWSYVFFKDTLNPLYFVGFSVVLAGLIWFFSQDLYTDKFRDGADPIPDGVEFEDVEDEL